MQEKWRLGRNSNAACGRKGKSARQGKAGGERGHSAASAFCYLTEEDMWETSWRLKHQEMMTWIGSFRGEWRNWYNRVRRLHGEFEAVALERPAHLTVQSLVRAETVMTTIVKAVTDYCPSEERPNFQLTWMAWADAVLH